MSTQLSNRSSGKALKGDTTVKSNNDLSGISTLLSPSDRRQRSVSKDCILFSGNPKISLKPENKISDS